MDSPQKLQKLVAKGWVSQALKKGSRDHQAVRALQTLLHDIGFGSDLNWERYGADGHYGSITEQAVKAFAHRNGMTRDGSKVSDQIAQKILACYDILDDLRIMRSLIRKNAVEKRLFCGSQDSVGIVALQTLLHVLGFDQQLNWERYGADGHYGSSTAEAVKAFARQHGHEVDGSRIPRELVEKILDQLTPRFGADWAQEHQHSETDSGQMTLRKAVEGGRSRLYLSDRSRQIRFTRFKKGLYCYGQHKPADFIREHRQTLNALGLPSSAINVILAVAENEGNLDAVNTWDNSFMTFGMFQWTVGAGSSPGELAALLRKLKATDAEVFERYFGSQGLDLTETGPVTGYLTLNGKRLTAPHEKDSLRSPDWAFRFGCAGQDPRVQSVQIKHALCRLDNFYRNKNCRVKGYDVAELVSSEYGVSLLLDNHVNRPGYLRACLEKALEKTALPAPETWGTEEERSFLSAYLDIRKTYGKTPMTDATKRAWAIQKHLHQGALSDQRGSFNYPSAEPA